MKKMLQYWFILISIATFVSCADNHTDSSESYLETSKIPAASVINYSIVQSYPHDTSAFTQGLELFNGYLLESTGLLGKSSLRKVDIKTGKVLKKLDMDQAIFAEGITSLNDTVYQLSWQNHLVFLYDANNIKPIGRLNWSGEGWGLANDGQNLIISDGSDKLYFVEPGTLKLNKVLSVVDQYGPVNNLNELEMVEGYIFANRWQYDYILKIDPANGHVIGTMNMKDFLQKNSRSDLGYLKQPGSTAVESGAVLNGIAYDKEKKSLYITGKLWPEIFELQLN
jgi:glutamine cyclotransferase